MSNTFTLDALREDVERKYAPVKIAVGKREVVLRHLIRMPKGDREAVVELLNKFKDAVSSGPEDKADDAVLDDDALLELGKEIVAKVAKDHGDVLVEALGDDLALTIHVLETWMEATQLGEAQNSPA